jgi:Cu-Zn family superoxide dismutase
LLLLACDSADPPVDEPPPPIQQSSPISEASPSGDDTPSGEDEAMSEAGTSARAPASAAPESKSARAELQPTEGNEVRGSVDFVTDSDGKLVVVSEVEGLAAGAHGLHIHENGDCSAPDASSAGGHFSPEEDPHGAPTDAPGAHHAGDLGNISADESGRATATVVDEELELEGRFGVIGRAVIVHSAEDDLESQPSGAAGKRLACGVIRAEGGQLG